MAWDDEDKYDRGPYGNDEEFANNLREFYDAIDLDTPATRRLLGQDRTATRKVVDEAIKRLNGKPEPEVEWTRLTDHDSLLLSDLGITIEDQ